MFAGTETWTQYKGVAVGMTGADYQQEFLAVWTKRNIWSERHPVRFAGEIITKSEMVPRAELERTEMFNDFRFAYQKRTCSNALPSRHRRRRFGRS